MLRHFSYCLLLLLAACQAGHHSFDVQLHHHEHDQLQLLTEYAAIKTAFENGHIMQARASVLALDRSHPDYRRAQRLLREQIEPARRRLYLHYLHTAKRLARHHLWFDAMWAYDQAAQVTLKPQQMRQRRDAMAAKMRHDRFVLLLQQRRKEDQRWLADFAYYHPPHGLQPDDRVYGYLRKRFSEAVDARADRAMQDARMFLREGVAEVAYVEVESVLRLQPQRKDAQQLMVQVRAALPAGFKIPAMPVASHGKRRSHPRHRQRQVSKADIERAMRQQDWHQAKQLMDAYQRHHGEDAEALMARVTALVNAAAARYFDAGSRAFRQEQLDQAIAAWRQAVALRPTMAEYVESLRRAEQLKERLQLLRQQAQSPSTPAAAGQ